MCGIAGLIHERSSPASREAVVARMVRRQAHRGPDDEGVASVGAATLGMSRLAIFDPAHGRQPMTTPDGRFHVVFNGAIYNFRELRAELEPKGWRFRTECDTEVLLAAFAEWGEACLPRLRGMFAFAVWDATERTLFLARDPFGIKPLYYARLSDGLFLFASELNALLASGLVDAEIDPAAVGDYLAWFAVPPPRTIYRGLANLPPGHALRVLGDGRMKIKPWWHFPTRNPAAAAGSPADLAQGLREQLRSTIRAHRLADVPVGAFLSGGLDSSAIVALMAAEGAAALKTFSLVFREAEFSEQAAARRIAHAIGTVHHETLLTGEMVAAELPRIIAALDQPTGDGVNTYFVSQAARRGGVTAVLSGLGGDEVFGGYNSFVDVPRMARWLPTWRRVPEPLRRRAAALARRRGARGLKLADFLTYARDIHELCALRRRVLSEPKRLELLTPAAQAMARRQGPFHPLLDDFALELARANAFQTVSGWEMRTYMADVLLRDSDVFSMAHSLELRVPFVDRELIEWWWSQPPAALAEAQPKAMLARAVADLLPVETLQRKKQGFALPFAPWMRGPLRPFLDEVFSSASLERCPWLEAAAVQRDWRAFQGGSDPRNWSRVWTLAILVAFANRRSK